MIAEARYGFRWYLAIYIIVNLGLVAIWYYTGHRISLALVPNPLLGPRGLGSLLGRVPHQRRGLD